ncbi:hypothetical protein [Paenibacillus sp. HJGM_3]|uniref:hypothetical protein n=1 Tax=Paenibacillus sp. HJGM_3 TaxID=3379816 RepID=UPI00385D9423
MSYGCPVCNGLQTLTKHCPGCGGSLSDGGRAEDYLGPYSPYRPIDDMKLTNGIADLANHICVHQLYCTTCGFTASVDVQEWRM